jgi:hypothetical protein
MRAPITVNYTPDGEDWTVTVTVAGAETTRSAKAVGLIAARDRADQLVAQIDPDEDGRRVVHLLDGDAYAFTNTYLQARLGLARPDSPKESTDQVVNNRSAPAPPWPDTTAETTETPADVLNPGKGRRNRR